MSNCNCTSHNHDHHHHDHDCGCGCNDTHEHSCDCGCGGHHHSTPVSIENLEQHEVNFLQHLIGYHYMPVSQFIVTSTKESGFASIALSPVFITEENNTMEQVRSIGDMLKGLEQKGYLTLDYDEPLKGYNYNEHYNSDVYAFFKQTVEEAKTKENFLGDTATIETGSIAPTEHCLAMLKV